MSIKQVICPDFWVCEWEDERSAGWFAVPFRSADIARYDAELTLYDMGCLEGFVFFSLRKPTLRERWEAA